jgi:hypothetical protein
METIFPEADGVSGAFLLGWRRRPGSAAGPDSIEQVITVVVKRAYSVTASASDPAAGGLTPDAGGPVIFEADQPGSVPSTVGYESDLVAYKPQGDLIAIADAPPAPLSISVNGTVRMSQATEAVPTLTGLGWEPRVGGTRAAEGGDFLALDQALPDGFENTYYNGYRRAFDQGGPVPYLAPGDQIDVERAGGGRYGFTLPTEVPALRHQWFVGEGVDDPSLWRGRNQPMALDTLVVEPDRDAAYAVWRAVWPVDLDPDGTGPVPLGDNRRLTVTLGGA